jgi:hypothetical protein
MKKIILPFIIVIFSISLLATLTLSKSIGEKCIGDSECDFGLKCNEGVCIKKKEFDFGSSGKTGKPCQTDADCIGSGKCVEGSFGKKYCSGN